MTYINLSKKTQGFTIVELIVIIVVIAILAAISIVSYSAVTKNARLQATQTDAQVMSAALKKYKAEQGGYPSSVNDLTEKPQTNGSTFQYTINSVTGVFCLTASQQDVDTYITSANSSPKDGVCPGHGVAGRPMVINLAQNPSAEAGLDGVTGYFSSPVTRTSGGAANRSYLFSTTTNSTTYAQGLIHTVTRSAKPNQQYTCSMAFKGTAGAVVRFSGRPATAADGYLTENIGWRDITLTTAWQRLSITFTTPANTGILRVQHPLATATSGVLIQSDALICTEGSVNYAYGDGASAGWAWLGNADAAASSGPRN